MGGMAIKMPSNHSGESFFGERLLEGRSKMGKLHGALLLLVFAQKRLFPFRPESGKEEGKKK
jgi:hypothetical protein